jgi:hypothetical protein
MGIDGIPIEKLILDAGSNVEAVAAEYTTLLRASVSASNDTALATFATRSRERQDGGAARGDHAGILPLRGAVAGGLLGRARFAMRLACLGLEQEFI